MFVAASVNDVCCSMADEDMVDDKIADADHDNDNQVVYQFIVSVNCAFFDIIFMIIFIMFSARFRDFPHDDYVFCFGGRI